jgi:predicted phosphodiesterase
MDVIIGHQNNMVISNTSLLPVHETELSDFFEKDVEDIEYGPSLDERSEEPQKLSPVIVQRLKSMQDKLDQLIDIYLMKIFEEKEAGKNRLAGIKKVNEIPDGTKILKDNYYYLGKPKYRNIYVISDLHASKIGLEKVIQETRYLEQADESLWIFLGDYIDRGTKDYWVLYHVLKMKIAHPDNVILLRGNHEYYKMDDQNNLKCIISPSDFYEYLKKVGELGEGTLFSDEFMKKIFLEFFKNMPAGVFLADKKNYFITHSGLAYPSENIDFSVLRVNNFDYFKIKMDRFPHIQSFDDLNHEENLKGILWTRLVDAPYKTKGELIGKENGIYEQRNFLEKLGIDILIRGHDHPPAGYEKTLDGKIITLISGGGNPDSGEFQNYGACVVRIGHDSEPEIMMLASPRGMTAN